MSKPILYPDLLAQQVADEHAVLTLSINPQLAFFNGHFDEIPIVPGVVQIQWAVHFGRQILPVTGAFSHMESVKFKELILPEQPFELVLRWVASSRKLDFSYRSPLGEHSSGRVYFHANDL